MGETSKLSGVLPRLLERDAESAWDAFLSEFAPLILQVVHLFERDRDEIEECFVFVCERLRRDGMRRIRRFRAEGTASFSTWLRAVARRLCLDWRRHRDGRFRLPRSIARLPELDREVFRCLHLRGLSENETFHNLQALWPALTCAQLADAAVRVEKSLSSRQEWQLLTRHPRLQSLSGDGRSDPGPEPADPRADPERDAARHESLTVLHRALGCLPSRARLLVRLRYEQELPLEEIARLTGLDGVGRVEREIRQALAALRAELAARGFTGLSVEGE